MFSSSRTRQRHKRLRRVDALLLEQLLVAAVAADDQRLGQERAQHVAALLVRFDDLDLHLLLDQLLGQIIGRFAAADNHAALHRVLIHPDAFKDVVRLAGGGENRDVVALVQHRRAVGDDDMPLVFHRADQIAEMEDVVELHHAAAVQDAPLGDLEAHQFPRVPSQTR